MKVNKGQEWAKMDTTPAVSLSLGLNASPKSSGVPKFGDVSEIGDFQASKDRKFWRKLDITIDLELYFDISAMDSRSPNITF